MRRDAKVDANQGEIVSALQAAGCSVFVAGRPVDLIVGARNVTILMEVKNPKTSYGRRGANSNQSRFMEDWRGGPVAIVDSPEAALRAVGVVK